MAAEMKKRVAIACQGGGSHTAFSAGVLQGLLEHLPRDVEIVALSGTSGGAMCAALAWDGLVHGDPARSVRRLGEFWMEVAARDPWDRLLNQSLQTLMMLRNRMVLPEVSPYDLPPWGDQRFKAMLEQNFDFKKLRELAKAPGAPALQIGAVEVMTGHFEVFTGPELTAECLLASAAIPELFRAVEVPGKGFYWDGLFSQNPPIHDLTDHDLHELWIIQINPSLISKLPTQTHEIMDRRNQLSGNLSMEQEVRIIQMVNRLVARGCLDGTKYHRVDISRIRMESEFGYASKLDRSVVFLKELMRYGRASADRYLKDRKDRQMEQPAASHEEEAVAGGAGPRKGARR